MVRHIVTFKLRGTAEERLKAATEFRDALLALPSVIPELVGMEAGVNENPKEEWDVALVAVVKTMADVAVYSAHPAHQAAAAIVAPLKESRACVDYEF